MPEGTLIDRLFYTLDIDQDPLQRGTRKAESTIRRFDMSLKSIAGLGIASAGVLLLGRRLFKLGADIVGSAATMERLVIGLTAVAGSSQAAQEQLADLREVAKLPGLGLQEAVEGSIQLQAVGFSADQAADSLKAYGNALATVGKGKADLKGVILALTQMQSKGKILAEELNQIAERVPQIRQVMKDAFGTANSEELQKMGITAADFIRRTTEELAKLPTVAGGAANDFENLCDTIFETKNSLGRLILPQVTGFVSALSSGLGSLNIALETSSEKMLRLTNEFASAEREQNAQIETLETLLSRYNELTEELDSGAGGATEMATKQQALNKTIAEIIKLAPQAAQGVNKYTRSMDIATGVLQGYIGALKTQRELEDRSRLLEISAEVETLFQAYQRATLALQDQNKLTDTTIREAKAAAQATRDWNVAVSSLAKNPSIRKLIEDIIIANEEAAKLAKQGVEISFDISAQENPLEALRKILGGPNALGGITEETTEAIFRQIQAIILLEREAKRVSEVAREPGPKAFDLTKPSAEQVRRTEAVLQSFAKELKEQERVAKEISDIRDTELVADLKRGEDRVRRQEAQAERFLEAKRDEASSDLRIEEKGQQALGQVKTRAMKKKSKEDEKAATAENKRQDELLERDLKRIETQAQREDRINADFAAARQAVTENDAAVVERGEAAITDANERSQEKIREEWEKTADLILDIMSIVGSEIGGTFGEIAEIGVDAGVAIAAAFAGETNLAITSATSAAVKGFTFIKGLFGDSEEMKRKAEDAEKQRVKAEREAHRAREQRFQSEGRSVASAFVSSFVGGLSGNDAVKQISDAVDKLIFDAITAAAIKKTSIQGLGRQFAIVLEDILEDNVIDERERATIQAARKLFADKQAQGVEITEQLAEAAGLDLTKFADKVEEVQTRQSRGVSLAIRTITSRQADGLSIILRGSQGLLVSIEQNTRRAADTLDAWLPDLASNMMIENSVDMPDKRKPRFAVDFQQRQNRDLTKRRRAIGRVNA